MHPATYVSTPARSFLSRMAFSAATAMRTRSVKGTCIRSDKI